MIHRKASEIMNTSVVTFRPDTDIYEAIRTFLKNRFSGAPVIDAEAKVIGILSELDCLRVLTAEAWDGFPEGKVGDYMTAKVASAIYWQALRLWAKRVPFFRKPEPPGAFISR